MRIRYNCLKNSNGFSILETIVAVGMLGITIALTASITSSVFRGRSQQEEKKSILNHLSVMKSTIEENDVCNGIIKSLPTNKLNLNELQKAVEINEIYIPGEVVPFLKKNRAEFGNALTVRNMILSLASPIARDANDSNIITNPLAFLWLNVEYEYASPKAPTFVGNKQAMLEVTVLNGKIQLGSCVDYVTRRDLEIGRIFCLFMNSPYDPNKTPACDLSENPEIRYMTCTMLGRKYEENDRYCGEKVPL